MSLLDVVQNPNKVAVSTTVQVSINHTFVGVIQSLAPSQTRQSTAVRGIGIGDRQVDRVWQVSDYTLTVQKMALFNKFLFVALGYLPNFRMIAELRKPIDILETILFPDGTQTRVTQYIGCFLNNYTAPRAITGEIIIMEDATFDVTSINDTEHDPFGYETGIN